MTFLKMFKGSNLLQMEITICQIISIKIKTTTKITKIIQMISFRTTWGAMICLPTRNKLSIISLKTTIWWITKEWFKRTIKCLPPWWTIKCSTTIKTICNQNKWCNKINTKIRTWILILKIFLSNRISKNKFRIYLQVILT